MFRDVADAALGGPPGEQLAALTSAPATLSRTARVSVLPQLFRGLNAGDAARAGTHRTYRVDRTIRGRNSGDG